LSYTRAGRDLTCPACGLNRRTSRKMPCSMPVANRCLRRGHIAGDPRDASSKRVATATSPQDPVEQIRQIAHRGREPLVGDRPAARVVGGLAFPAHLEVGVAACAGDPERSVGQTAASRERGAGKGAQPHKR